MATLCKLDQVAIRIIFCREVGARLHAFYKDGELVVSLTPLRIIQGDAPAAIRNQVLAWAAQHRSEVLANWRRYEAGKRLSLAFAA